MDDDASKDGKELLKRPIASEIESLLRRVDALPLLDSRPEEEIFGYGDDGIPR
jgi:hypothetical protein